jgi:hypothetical protein
LIFVPVAHSIHAVDGSDVRWLDSCDHVAALGIFYALQKWLIAENSNRVNVANIK